MTGLDALKELAGYANRDDYYLLIPPEKSESGKKEYRHRKATLTDDLIEQHHAHEIDGLGINIKKFPDKTHIVVVDFDDKTGANWDLMVKIVGNVYGYLKYGDAQLRIFCVRSGSGTGFHIWFVFKDAKRVNAARDWVKSYIDGLETCGVTLREGSGGVVEGHYELFPKGNAVNVALPLAQKSVLYEAYQNEDGETFFHEADNGTALIIQPIEGQKPGRKRQTGAPSGRKAEVNEEAAVAAYKVALGSKVENYEAWYKSGFHFKAAGIDFELWHAWCAEIPNYPGRDAVKHKWDKDLANPRCGPEVFWANAKRGGYAGGYPNGIDLRGAGGDRVLLFDLVDEIELFRSELKEPYARLSPKRVARVMSSDFEHWLRLAAEEQLGLHPSVEQVLALQKTLAARASREPAQEVFLRVAETDDGTFIDLGDDDFTVLRMTADGWEETDHAPPFRRTVGRELPMPARGGSIQDLRPFFNVDDDGFILELALLVKSYFTKSEHPIACFTGPKDSAKTSSMRFHRALIDPAPAADAGPPKDEDALGVRAMNNYAVTIDNARTVERLSDCVRDQEYRPVCTTQTARCSLRSSCGRSSSTASSLK